MAYQISEFSSGTKMESKVIKMKKKISSIFGCETNISRWNFENLVGQFLGDMFEKICANF